MAILVMVLLVVTAIGVGGITYMFTNEGCKEKISKLEAELGEKDKKIASYEEALKARGLSCDSCHVKVDFHTPEELKAKNKDARLCIDCHGDIHDTHKNQPCEICHLGKGGTFTFPTPKKGNILICENCHDKDYLELHKDVLGCRGCHTGDVMDYHKLP